MTMCERCVHEPICEWVARDNESFKYPCEEGMRCVLFCEKEKKVECECTEANCTDFDHTIAMMRHPNYKRRFEAEYHQTKIRYEKLKAFNTKIEAAQLTVCTNHAVEVPIHDCPAPLLREQQSIMGQYLHILEVRAQIEGIELD